MGPSPAGGQRGLTLVELLVVMVILSVVTTMLVMIFINLQGAYGFTVNSAHAREDARGAMANLAPLFDQVICTSSSSPRALTPEEMLEAVLPYNSFGRAVHGVGKAIEVGKGIAGKNGFLFVSGSLYTIGEAMKCLEGRHGP